MENGFLGQLKSFTGRHKYLIVAVLFLLVILVASDNSMIRRIAQKREIRALQQQLDEYSRQNDRNMQILDELNDDSLIIDRLARERFGMSRDDEDVFIEK
ncbi:MAG: septum formation initiator family protein [Bacteroidaceae bacterium]|nr:septum formation initiator family protein [Candidatus Colenecus caballi]MCQ2071504.1 septum formation initiator family protein [Bacteroidaceae bacterium]